MRCICAVLIATFKVLTKGGPEGGGLFRGCYIWLYGCFAVPQGFQLFFFGLGFFASRFGHGPMLGGFSGKFFIPFVQLFEQVNIVLHFHDFEMLFE